MLILAFDTSSKTASVSVLRDENVLYDIILNTGQNHSEVLLPAVNEACAAAGCKISEIDLFACTLGPGSFTGLRIGVSTLKGLMMAQIKPAVGVSSLAALALNIVPGGKTICSVMDAGRGQVYTACYQYAKDSSLLQVENERALAPDRMDLKVKEPVVYVGEGAVKYHEEIRRNSAAGSEFADDDLQFIHASSVGRLALKKFRQGEVLELNRCVPVYLRSADALPKKQMFP